MRIFDFLNFTLHAIPARAGWVVLSLIAAAEPVAAAPDDAAGPPELIALQAEALAHSPALRAADLELAASREDAAQARALPDPSVGVNYTNDGTAWSLGKRDMSVLNLTWNQMLPGFGKRAARSDAARHEFHHTGANRMRLELSVKAQVARAYWSLLALDEQRRQTEELRGDLRLIESSARARFSSGLGGQTEVLRAQTEALRVGERLAAITAEQTRAQASLTSLLGRSDGRPVALSGELPARVAPPQAGEILRTLGERSPDLEARRAEIDADDAAVRMARLERRPDFGLMAGYGNRGGLDPMVMVGVTISLPRRGRVGPLLSAAEFRAQAGREHLAAQRLEMESRTRARIARFTATNETLRLYAEGILPQDALAVKAALSEYGVGRIPLADALMAVTAATDDRMRWIDLRREALFARIAVETLESGEDEPLEDLGPHHASAMR